jgi:hypothetical protein
MKKLLLYLSAVLLLAACGSNTDDSQSKQPDITLDFVKENAEIGLTYDEVRGIFGTEELSDVVDSTETWLYDSSPKNNFEYEQSLEVINSDVILSGDLDYQLYINFMEEKAFMYSYFYKGDDGQVWQYQVIPNNEPLHIPI